MESSVEVSYNFMGYNNSMGRTAGNFSKRNSEDGDARISITEECDSTTGPANPKVQFTVGEDVFYHEETGQNVLGTVALVQGKKVKIIFMDETEKWAHISRVKKIVDDNEESKPNGADASTECQSNDGGAVSSASKKKSKGDINGQGVPRENLPVICGSCGTQKYKTAEPVERRRLLLLALKNANLRFVNDDERKPNPLWAIKDHTNKGLNNMMIKPPVTGGRAVTAAGFPISVRTSNPEAASVAMSNIAHTIAVNKVINVPTPKNSPSLVPQKSNSVTKTGGAGTLGMLSSTGRKLPKAQDHPPVAKKTGSELNAGVQQRSKCNDIWPQSRYQKTTFLSEMPKSNVTNNVGHRSGEDGSSVPSNNHQHSNANGNRIQAQPSYKQNASLSASPGGAARVSGMVLSPTPAVASTEVKVNCGSYPVRKTGSPMLNRSIRVEPVERKKAGDSHQQSYRFDEGGRKVEELIRESPGFNNTSQQKISLKRKLSLGKSPEAGGNTSFSRMSEGQSGLAEAKKLRMSLPNSTDVTSQRVPSPTKPPDSDLPPRGTKKAMSPLQKLSDLQKNGGLTVACLTHTESGVQTVAINASALEDSTLVNGKESKRIDVLRLSPERYEALLTTPIKNTNGATAAKVDGGTPVITLQEADDDTKEKANNVTTSPRAFKLASVSSPGTSTKSSPINERRMARPVILKRTVVANAQSEKQSKDSTEVSGKSKKVNMKGNNAAAAALVAKASRGRPKKPFKLQLRKPMGMAYDVGQFNGPVQNEESENAVGQTINELDYTWSSSTINDLLQYGQGYRLECLPRVPDKKQDLVNQAVEHLKDEVTPRPPSYWSTSANPSKKPTNQKSLKDLKNVDSYYISGRSIGVNGIQYQVVWRDGYGFEYSSEDEQELGVGLGEENYLYFEDYDPDEYFLDKIPVTVNNVTGHCDNNSTGSEDNSDRMDVDEGTEGRLCYSNKTNISNDVSGVKREPLDSSAENSPTKVVIPASKSAEANNDPYIIDLTDSP